MHVYSDFILWDSNNALNVRLAVPPLHNHVIHITASLHPLESSHSSFPFSLAFPHSSTFTQWLHMDNCCCRSWKILLNCLSWTCWKVSRFEDGKGLNTWFLFTVYQACSYVSFSNKSFIRGIKQSATISLIFEEREPKTSNFLLNRNNHSKSKWSTSYEWQGRKDDVSSFSVMFCLKYTGNQ